MIDRSQLKYQSLLSVAGRVTLGIFTPQCREIWTFRYFRTYLDTVSAACSGGA